MNQVWKKTVMGIIWSLVLMLAGTILAGIMSVLAVAGGLLGSGGAFGAFGVMAIIFVLAALGGYIWFFINLSQFIPQQKTPEDRSAISNVRTAYIISLVGTILGLIPVAGIFLALICGLISSILLIIAYGNFSNSQAMNGTGRSGASLLKTAAIISLVCSILSIIPILNILAIIGQIVALILIFMGWSKVSNGMDY